MVERFVKVVEWDVTKRSDFYWLILISVLLIIVNVLCVLSIIYFWGSFFWGFVTNGIIVFIMILLSLDDKLEGRKVYYKRVK
jgi:hypothetical protein